MALYSYGPSIHICLGAFFISAGYALLHRHPISLSLPAHVDGLFLSRSATPVVLAHLATAAIAIYGPNYIRP